MDNFDLRKYLAKNPLLQEAITNKFVYSDGDNLVFSDEESEDFDSIKIPNSPFLFVYANDESVNFIAAKTKDEFVNKVNDEYHGEIEGDTDEMYNEILDIANDSYISGDSNNVEVVIDNGKVVAQGGSVSGLGKAKTAAKTGKMTAQEFFDEWKADGEDNRLVFVQDKVTGSLNGVLPDNFKVFSLYIDIPLDRLPENLDCHFLTIVGVNPVIPSTAKIYNLKMYSNANPIIEEGCVIRELLILRARKLTSIPQIKGLLNCTLEELDNLDPQTLPVVSMELRLFSCNTLTNIGDNRNLYKLQLYNMANLTELPNNLTIRGDLIIDKCPKLKSLPPDLKVGGEIRIDNKIIQARK